MVFFFIYVYLIFQPPEWVGKLSAPYDTYEDCKHGRILYDVGVETSQCFGLVKEGGER